MNRRGSRQTTRRILWSRLLTHSGDQAWDFSVPLVLASLFPHDISKVAWYYLLVRSGHMLLVTRACALMDQWSRLRSIRVGIGCQTAAVILGTLAIHRLVDTPAESSLWSTPAIATAFVTIVVAGLIGSLSASMMEIAVSQDWLPTVVPHHELTHINSYLKQIDLLTELAAPVVAGVLLTIDSPAVPLLGLKCVAMWNLVSFIPEYRLLRAAYRAEEKLTRPSALTQAAAKLSLIDSLRGGWRDFLNQPAAFAMISYALLWLTILSPHGVILASWLTTQWHLSEPMIGAFRGFGAVFGLLATVIYPRAAAKWSLVSSTRFFILWEAGCLMAASAAFLNGEGAVVWFACFILLSRLGLYGFTLGETEIRQRTIRPETRGRVNGFAQALTSLATLGVYGSAALLDAPKEFPLLVHGSTFFVGLGALTFCFWSWSAKAKPSR